MPRITCTGNPEQRGCGTVLVHPPSAAFVRCAVCAAITPCGSSGEGTSSSSSNGTTTTTNNNSAGNQRRVRFGPSGGREMAAIQCQGCTVRLMFHLGATQVQCALCHTVNRVVSGGGVQRQDVSHCTCRGCGVTLMYTRGATSVSCGACHAVTNTAGIAAEREGNSKMNSGDEERELVVVENPPVKLRDGRVMPNVSVAVEIHSAKNTKK